MDTEVDVPNPKLTIVPGMYAEVHLHLADREGVLSVPLDAVEGLDTESEQVYRVGSDTPYASFQSRQESQPRPG
jgi:multidrug efflux pump subunit AcrA (membrane-fusion protein)